MGRDREVVGLNPGSTKCCVLEQDTLLLVSTNEDLPRMLARVFGSTLQRRYNAVVGSHEH